MNWTVNNCTFTNNTFADTVVNVTGTASQNVTVQNCVVSRGGRSLSFVTGNAGTIGLTANNNTVNGDGVTPRGFAIQTNGTVRLSGRLTFNNVTGCTQEGVGLLALIIAMCGCALTRIASWGTFPV